MADRNDDAEMVRICLSRFGRFQAKAESGASYCSYSSKKPDCPYILDEVVNMPRSGQRPEASQLPNSFFRCSYGNNAVLIVDDISLMTVESKVLTPPQYTTITALNSQSALNYLREFNSNGKQKVKVFATGYAIKERNGLQLLEDVADEFPDTTRILCTSYGNIAHEGLESGLAHIVMIKIYDMFEFKKTIDLAISMNEQRKRNK